MVSIGPRKEVVEMDTIIVEIRSGEGGDDAKDLVLLNMGLYVKFARRRCL